LRAATGSAWNSNQIVIAEPVAVAGAAESPVANAGSEVQPEATPDKPAVADQRSRDQVLVDYFRDKHEARQHPKQDEALKALKAAGKTWDRRSFRTRFNELARRRGVRVGRGVR
jgi:hypothetical protein